MTIRKLLTKGLPDPAEVDNRPVAEQILDSPLLAPARLAWAAFMDLRPYWPIVIPYLLMVGVRAYRRERKHYLLTRALHEAQPIDE